MSPKDKANSFVTRFFPYVDSEIAGEKDFEYSYQEKLKNAKYCALIMVDEIVNALNNTTGHCELRKVDLQEVQSDIDFWGKVKHEIEKL